MLILRGHTTGKVVWGLAFSPDSTRLASSANDDTVRLWDLATGKNEVIADASSDYLSFSPDGKQLLYGEVTEVYLHDLETRQRRTPGVSDWEDRVKWAACAWAANELLIVVGNRLCRHDLPTLAYLRDWPTSDVLLSCLALSREGKTLATAHQIVRPNRAYAYHIRLWDYATKAMTTSLDDSTSEPTSLTFSRDGRWLAAACGTSLYVWEIASKRLILLDRPDKSHFKDVAFSPDNLWLGAAHNDKSVRLYSTLTWKPEHAFDWTIGSIVRIAFAPDGMRAAASGKTGRIAIWDMDL